MNKKRQQGSAGFTLIEALTAMAVLTVGIITLYTMHIVAIKGNTVANSLTTAANWNVAKVEELQALPYDDPDLMDGDGANNGCAGLDDWPDADFGPVTSGIYSVYWNVATDCTLTDVPLAQRPKHIRVIVNRSIKGVDKQVVFNYIKQNNL